MFHFSAQIFTEIAVLVSNMIKISELSSVLVVAYAAKQSEIRVNKWKEMMWN
jgi:hypothetical protein